MAFQLKNLVELTKLAIKHNASDIHLRSTEAPVLRINNSLVPVQTPPLSLDDILDVCSLLLETTRDSITMKSVNEKDGACEIEGLCRFRFNIFCYSDNLGIVMRLINTKIPSLESLGFSPVVQEIANYERGLVLVTGATGSGKSTTLAAMIDYINTHKPYHIVTLEDPVEYLHPQKKSRVTQRDMGVDSTSFATALRSLLRQDPDVILIGEMRDPETVEIALKAAETGHLVFSTLHTTNATNTIGRILSMFDGENKQEIRKRLSETLKATIGQRMLESKRNKIIIAQEVMTMTPNVRDIILGSEPLSKLSNIIEKGYEEGGTGRSQTFDQHLFELLKKKQITEEEALKNADNEYNFQQQLLVE